MVKRRPVRDPRLGSLPTAVDWIRERWGLQREAPIRLHLARSTDGELGAPRYTGAFAASLSWSPDVVVQVEGREPCGHPLSGGRGEGCPDCGGEGVKDFARDRYPYPMSTALARLANAAEGTGPLRVILGLAEANFDPAILVEQGVPPGRILEAITMLYDRFSSGPVARPGWTSLSESQQRALLAVDDPA